MSALHEQLRHAAEAGDLPAVQAALAAGADIHANNAHVLKVAAWNGHLDLVKYLLGDGGLNQVEADHALHLAASNGELAGVACLIAAGADLHSDRERALCLAAQKGHQEVVQYLLAAGADVKASRGSALYWAVLRRHKDVIRVLRQQGDPIRPLLKDIHLLPESVQLDLLEEGDVSEVSVVNIARQGVRVSALRVLLQRQGHGELAAMISATQMLEPLTPDARAEMLGELTAKQSQPEIDLVGP